MRATCATLLIVLALFATSCGGEDQTPAFEGVWSSEKQSKLSSLSQEYLDAQEQICMEDNKECDQSVKTASQAAGKLGTQLRLLRSLSPQACNDALVNLSDTALSAAAALETSPTIRDAKGATQEQIEHNTEFTLAKAEEVVELTDLAESECEQFE